MFGCLYLLSCFLFLKSGRIYACQTGSHEKQLIKSQKAESEMKKRMRKRQKLASTNNSLPDVLSMLINWYKVLLIRISQYLASFLALRLNIVARVWPHRDQFQVYGLDLLLLSGLYGKTGNRLPSMYIRVYGATGFHFPVTHETAEKPHSAKQYAK